MRLVFGSTMLIALMLAGCGESATPETTSAKPPAEPSTQSTPQNEPQASMQDSPLANKTFSVVTTGTASPFSFRNEKGGLKGIDVDIIKAIAHAQGFQVTFFEKPWHDVLLGIESGEYDIAMNGINYSDERNEKYALTDPYFYNPSALMYKQELVAQPTKLADLAGMSVAVMKSSKQDDEVSAIAKTQVQRETNFYMAYKALVQNKVQVVAYDMAVMQSLVKEYDDKTVTIVPYEDKTNKATYNIFVVHKDNQVLQQALNDGLAKLRSDGKLDEIAKQYIGESQ